LDQEREYCRKRYIKTALAIARHDYENRNVHNCFTLFEKMIKIDPFDEEVLLEYLDLLLRENRVSKANRAAQKMKVLYENEVGICIDKQISDVFLKYKVQQSYI
jgi:DNA-binding SARP family transcriptional activator